MGKIIQISTISIIIIFFLTLNVYAFENEIYKMEIPEDYATMSYSGLDIFTKTEDEGILVYTLEAVGLKKNISTMTNSEIEELVGGLFKESVQVIEQCKEKLGKSKAIKARVLNKDDYMDTYIVVSDKHILLVFFTAKSEIELDSVEYREIKDSFRMKEKTTNATFIKFGMGALVCAGAVFKVKNQFF